MIAGLSFTSCESENEFKIVGAPYITITMDGKTVATLDDAQQYTLNLESNEYTNAAKDNILAASKFDVRSNLRWKIVPVDGETIDWLTPFPADGEKDGMFFFKTSRNIDPENAREAYYNICVDKGNGFEALPGMLIVNQKASAKFFEYTPTNSNIEATARNYRVYVYSNVDWTYDIEPMADYATENVDWIVDTNYHAASKQIDTLLFRVSANDGAIRGFNVNLHYTLDGEAATATIPVTQYSATEASVEGLPVQWVIGIKTGINYTDTWPGSGYINATTGSGQISYYSVPDKPDVDNKFTRVVGSGGDPYVTGVWPGDYWEFKNDSPVASGSILKIIFETSTSAQGMKYWRLEYKDGDEWLVPESAKLTATVNGEEIVYTHSLLPNSSDKIQVNQIVKLQNTTDVAAFRFVCAANWRSNDSGPVTAPVGGTCRLTLIDNTSTEGYPTISCVAAGSEEIKTADISVSGVNDDLMTFEGTPAASQSFAVTSSVDFTVTTSDSWITVDTESGLADTETTVKVSCANNVSANVRRGKVDIKAGVSHYYIAVVQGGAGGDLDPLISVSTGNRKSVSGEGETFNVAVQANVVYKVELPSWITENVSLTTASVVQSYSHSFTAEPNLTGADRTGSIRFYNEESNVESVVTVSQEQFTPAVTVSGIDKYSKGVTSATFSVTTNVDVTISGTTGLTLSATSLTAGTSDLTVTFPANANADDLTHTLTFVNDKYSYTYNYAFTQFGTNTLFYDDFSWLTPLIKEFNAIDGNQTIGNAVTGYSLPEEYAAASAAYAPQIYNTTNGGAFQTAFTAQGYEDMNPTAKVIYVQDSYLKLDKTDVNTSLKLPAVADAGSGADVTLEFDWCAHMSAKGNVDKTSLIVVIDGNGTFENGTKYSDKLTHSQAKTYMYWTHASVKISGMDKDTRLILVQANVINTSTGEYTYSVSKSGAFRWHIDNIKITK